MRDMHARHKQGHAANTEHQRRQSPLRANSDRCCSAWVASGCAEQVHLHLVMNHLASAGAKKLPPSCQAMPFPTPITAIEHHLWIICPDFRGSIVDFTQGLDFRVISPDSVAPLHVQVADKRCHVSLDVRLEEMSLALRK